MLPMPKMSLEVLSSLLLWSKASTAGVSFRRGRLACQPWKLKGKSTFLMIQQMLQL